MGTTNGKFRKKDKFDGSQLSQSHIFKSSLTNVLVMSKNAVRFNKTNLEMHIPNNNLTVSIMTV